jgi:hypothetical protein
MVPFPFSLTIMSTGRMAAAPAEPASPSASSAVHTNVRMKSSDSKGSCIVRCFSVSPTRSKIKHSKSSVVPSVRHASQQKRQPFSRRLPLYSRVCTAVINFGGSGEDRQVRAFHHQSKTWMPAQESWLGRRARTTRNSLSRHRGPPSGPSYNWSRWSESPE